MLLLTLTLGVIFVPILVSIYFRLTNGKCRSSRRLDGKTVLITGGTSGIGLEYLLEIARRGAKIIIACRNLEKGRNAVTEIISQTGNKDVRMFECDVSSFGSVLKCCDAIKAEVNRIDVFCCYAAAVGDSPTDRPTQDGFELHFQANYLSHLVMIASLLPCFKVSPDCRIIMTSSAAYLLGSVKPIEDLGTFPSKRQPFERYGDSKLAMIMITKQLSRLFRREKDYSNVSINAFHPGAVHTDGMKHTPFLPLKYFLVALSWVYGKTPEDGAQTMLHLTVAEKVSSKAAMTSGLFWADCQPAIVANRQANDKELCRRLWMRSVQLIEPFVDVSCFAL